MLVHPTGKNRLTSEEDDCCVQNVSIWGAKYIEKVEEFNSRPTKPKYNHQIGTLQKTVITRVDNKKKNSTETFIRDDNICRGLSNSLLYEKHYLVLSWKLKNETIIPVYWELQRMCLSPVLVDDKNPGYFNDLNVIQRARKQVSYKCCIHLTRPPITNILPRIKCSDIIPRSMMNVYILDKGEANSDWRCQGVQSIKFHYIKGKYWLPVELIK